MTILEAIKKLLRQSGRPMTTQEIAETLNKNKWHQPSPSFKLSAYRIYGLAKSNPAVFNHSGETISLIQDLSSEQITAPVNSLVAPKIEYENKIVAFIDVLGFSEIVYSKSIEPIQSFFNYIISEFNEDLKSFQFGYLLISDTIVIHLPTSKINFENLVIIVAKLQMKLITRGVVVRGAISFGDLFVDQSKNIIVGVGLINAYILEKEAHFPRVVVDRKLIPLFYKNSVEMLDDNHGRIIIDAPNSYIRDYPYINYTYKLAIVMQIPKLNKVRELLKNNYYLNKNIDKYVWLIHHILFSFQEQMQFLNEKETKNKRDLYRMRLLTAFKKDIEVL